MLAAVGSDRLDRIGALQFCSGLFEQGQLIRGLAAVLRTELEKTHYFLIPLLVQILQRLVYAYQRTVSAATVLRL